MSNLKIADRNGLSGHKRQLDLVALFSSLAMSDVSEDELAEQWRSALDLSKADCAIEPDEILIQDLVQATIRCKIRQTSSTGKVKCGEDLPTINPEKEISVSAAKESSISNSVRESDKISESKAEEADDPHTNQPESSNSEPEIIDLTGPSPIRQPQGVEDRSFFGSDMPRDPLKKTSENVPTEKVEPFASRLFFMVSQGPVFNHGSGTSPRIREKSPLSSAKTPRTQTKPGKQRRKGTVKKTALNNITGFEFMKSDAIPTPVSQNETSAGLFNEPEAFTFSVPQAAQPVMTGSGTFPVFESSFGTETSMHTPELLKPNSSGSFPIPTANLYSSIPSDPPTIPTFHLGAVPSEAPNTAGDSSNIHVNSKTRRQLRAKRAVRLQRKAPDSASYQAPVTAPEPEQIPVTQKDNPGTEAHDDNNVQFGTFQAHDVENKQSSVRPDIFSPMDISSPRNSEDPDKVNVPLFNVDFSASTPIAAPIFGVTLGNPTSGCRIRRRGAKTRTAKTIAKKQMASPTATATSMDDSCNENNDPLLNVEIRPTSKNQPNLSHKVSSNITGCPVGISSTYVDVRQSSDTDHSVSSASTAEEKDYSGRAQRIEALRHEAKEAYTNQNYKSSIRCYTEAISLSRQRLLSSPQRQSSLPTFEENELSSGLLGNRAAALMMLGAYHAAVSDCTMAVNMTKELITSVNSKGQNELVFVPYTKYMCRLGRAHLKMGQVSEAKKWFNNTTVECEKLLSRLCHVTSSTAEDVKRALAQILNDASLGHADVNRYLDFSLSTAQINEHSVTFMDKALLIAPASLEVCSHCHCLSFKIFVFIICPGTRNLQLIEKKVQLLASLKRWIDVSRQCELTACDTIKYEGVLVGDLKVHDPFPEVSPSTFLKADSIDSSAPLSKTLNTNEVAEAVLRLPTSIVLIYLRALRLEERYPEAFKASKTLLAFTSPGKNRERSGTFVAEEFERLKKTLDTKDRGDNNFKCGDYFKAALNYTDCLKIDSGKDVFNLPSENSGGRLHAVLFCNRAACYMALKKYREASRDCTAALHVKVS